MSNIATSKLTVRTSGRRTMRRCLRKWGWSSSMRTNLQRKGVETNINFWFGSAIHFAMEDFFGYNKFGGLTKAFAAYYAAFKSADRPVGADEHYYLGMGMLEYFEDWYPKHNLSWQFETVWLDGDGLEVKPGTPDARPLVEESFILNLGHDVWVRDDTGQIVDCEDPRVLWGETGGRRYFMEENTEGTLVQIFISKKPTYYHGTLDRVVKDAQGRWWIMDWKTAKGADTNKLDTDDQISAYLWAAEQWFGRPIHGFVYVQLTKELAKPPKRLNSGGISVDKKQKTTHQLTKQEIINVYGSVQKAPNKVIEFLNHIAAQETPEGDRYIRWDMVYRTQAQKVATFMNICGELALMTNPNLYLFPNFTRDCSWDCPFRDACMLIEDGKPEEANTWLYSNFEERPREEDGNIDAWRKDIPWPDTDRYAAVATLTETMAANADIVLDLILPDKYKDLIEDER